MLEHFEFYHYIMIFVGVFFAGMLDAIVGGGGLITVPIYILAGLPDSLILGTNKVVSTCGTFMAVCRYIRHKAIRWRVATISALMSLIFSGFGARLSTILSSTYMIYILIVLLPIILFFNNKLDFKRDAIDSPLSWRQIVIRATLIGTIMGLYDGFFGPGTGTLLLVAFFIYLHFDAKIASATGRVVNFASNIASAIYFSYNGLVHWQVALLAIFASVCGNWIGSALVLEKSKTIMKPLFNVVIVLLLLKCVHGLFF